MKSLVCGPYVGSFEQELLTFRPHAKWISDNLPHDNVIVSTHKNRAFMYDWAEVLPVEDNLTTNEAAQVGLLNKNLGKREYSHYTKEIKLKVAKKHDILKKNVKLYPLSYTQSPQSISNYQKRFEPITIPTDIKDSISSDTILFIPDISETEDRLQKFLSLIQKEYNVKVIGNSKIHLQDQNVLANKGDDLYKYIIKWMAECKMVVCPASYWTFLAKLQGVNVFSWGEGAQQYKAGNHSLILPGKQLDINTLYKQFSWYNSKHELSKAL